VPPNKKSSVSGPRLPDAGRRAGEFPRLPAFDIRADDCLDSECGWLKWLWTCGEAPEIEADRGDDCSVMFVPAGVSMVDGGVGNRVCSVEVGDGSCGCCDDRWIAEIWSC